MTAICPTTNVAAASLTSILCYQTSHFPITYLRFIYLFIHPVFIQAILCSARLLHCGCSVLLLVSYVCALLKCTSICNVVSLYSEASWKM